MNRVIVTGANGFIGSQLVSELIAAEIPVTALVRPNSNIDILKESKCYNIIKTNNYLDPSVQRQLTVSRPDYIVHCAWQKISKNNTSSIINNMNLLIKSLELASYLNCKGFVSIGTHEEYGIKEGEIKESDNTNPMSSVGKAKLATCLTNINYCESNSMKGCHVRLSSAYNSKKDNKWPMQSIITDFSKGEVPEIPNSLQNNDFIHVSDIARGIISLMENNSSGVYNLASGETVQLKSLVKMIKNELKSNINPKFIETNLQRNFNINIEKIYNDSGWKPSISIWDGISLLLQEEKFTSKASFSDFSNRIRELCKTW